MYPPPCRNQRPLATRNESTINHGKLIGLVEKNAYLEGLGQLILSDGNSEDDALRLLLIYLHILCFSWESKTRSLLGYDNMQTE